MDGEKKFSKLKKGMAGLGRWLTGKVLAQSSTLMHEAGYRSAYLRSQFWGVQEVPQNFLTRYAR